MSSDEPPRTFTYIKHSSISFDIHMENQHYECTVYRCLYLVCYTKKLFFFLTLRTTMRHDNISFPLNNSVFLKLTQQSNLQSVWLWFGVLFCLQSFFIFFISIVFVCQDCTVLRQLYKFFYISQK